MERISWNQYFMAQSHLLALRSTCERLAVGATMVGDKRIIAGDVHCADVGCYVIDHHCVRTIHAEMNAILQCAKFGAPTADAEIYVTHFPCLQCCKAIIQAGIRTVYYAKDYKNHPYAIDLFEQAGVQTEQVELDEMIIDLKNQEKLAFVADLIGKLSESGLNEKEIRDMHEKANQLFTSYV